MFNTPNANSRPGLPAHGLVDGRAGCRWSCGWRGVPSALRMRASRVPARTLAGRDRRPGRAAGTLLADRARRAACSTRSARPRGLRTARTAAYLRWRYGLPALGYRAIAIDDDPAAGLAVFRLRRRGDAVEAGISDVLVPHGSAAARARSCSRTVARETGADYAIRVGRDRRLGRYAPASSRSRARARSSRGGPLADRSAPPALRDLDFALGDVELL